MLLTNVFKVPFHFLNDLLPPGSSVSVFVVHVLIFLTCQMPSGCLQFGILEAGFLCVCRWACFPAKTIPQMNRPAESSVRGGLPTGTLHGSGKGAGAGAASRHHSRVPELSQAVCSVHLKRNLSRGRHRQLVCKSWPRM